MNNAELIKALRWCQTHGCSKCVALLESGSCKYGGAIKIFEAAADALEAAEKRIAELEKRTKLPDRQEFLARGSFIEEPLSRPKEDEWIKYNNPNYSPFDDSGEYLYQCKKCGKVVVKATNYCPNCGAMMRGEHDELES